MLPARPSYGGRAISQSLRALRSATSDMVFRCRAHLCCDRSAVGSWIGRASLTSFGTGNLPGFRGQTATVPQLNCINRGVHFTGSPYLLSPYSPDFCRRRDRKLCRIGVSGEWTGPPNVHQQPPGLKCQVRPRKPRFTTRACGL